MPASIRLAALTICAAFTYGLYCVMCLLAALFVWRLVPETKGKTLEDMSALWRSRGRAE